MAGNALRLVISISAPADSARWVVQHLLICALWSYHGFILELSEIPRRVRNVSRVGSHSFKA
jgi:hypothetical protein